MLLTPARLAYFWRYPFDRSPVLGVASSVGEVRPPYQEIYSPLSFTVWGLLAAPAHVVAPSVVMSGADTTEPEAYALNPAIYHTFNLGLHLVNVLLVFALLRQFVKQEWAAALGAAVFALHPVQVEPVAWVTGMNNLLSGFFALLALLLYLKKKDESEKPRWVLGAYWGSTFCFLLSVLSKPSSVTLPVLALLLCWGLGEKWWRSRLMEMVPWAAIALFCVATNAVVAHGNDSGLTPMSWQRPFLVGDALTFYGCKLFFPWHLAPDYGRRPEWVMAQPLTYVVWLVPVAVLWFVWSWWKRALSQGRDADFARIALACLALFAVVLLPTSGIIGYYFHHISTVSDRYMYMALLGPAILVAVLASRAAALENPSMRRGLTVLSVIVVGAMMLLSFKQTQYWQSDVPLWSHNVAVVPQSTVAYYQYGVALYSEHDYRGAIPVLEQGLRANPQSWMVEITLGNAYFQVGDAARAESHFRHALEIWPNAIEQFRLGLQLQPENPLLLAYMGFNMTAAAQSAEGIVYLRNALKLGFDPAKGHFYPGNALAGAGNIPDAVQEWTMAARLDPGNYEAIFDLGIAAVRAGDVVQARQFFERTVQIQPGYAPAQVQLGLLWQKQGQINKAKAAFRAALHSDPQNAVALKALQSIP